MNYKRTVFVLILFSSFFLGRCYKKETENACQSSYPMEDVIWLKKLANTITNCSCETSIVKGRYKGQTVFYIQITDPLCNSTFPRTLYDCYGTNFKSFMEDDYDEFTNYVIPNKVLYRCKKSINQIKNND